MNKIKICESESSETMYWLEIIIELKWMPPERTKLIFKEADELLSIFTSVGSKLKCS